MSYSKKVNQVAATEQKSYLSTAGIHENIFVKSVTLTTWTNGDCMDITLSNEAGETISTRIFPFTPTGWKTKTVEGVSVTLTPEEEEEAYLLNIKHIFAAAVGEENYDKAIDKATDFKAFATILGKMSRDVYPASKSFRIMLISKLNKKDNRYYVRVPEWSNGFVEASDSKSNMKFNAEKYGKTNEKPKVEDNKPKATDSSSELPF